MALPCVGSLIIKKNQQKRKSYLRESSFKFTQEAERIAVYFGYFE